MKVYSEKDKIRLQTNLSLIRKAAGWTATDLGEFIGVTKQTISNLENGRNTMSKAQYIAIRAILDHELTSNPDNDALAQIVHILLDSDNLTEEDRSQVESTIAYISRAKEKNMNHAAIAAGTAALLASIGLGLVGGLATTPIWLDAIKAAKKK